MTDEQTRVAPPRTGILRCAFHPKVETVLRCGKCDRPICVRCLIQTPVGGRCRECAQMRRLPQFETTPSDLSRGLLVAIGLGLAGGLALGLVSSMVRGFAFVLMVGAGYLIGGWFSDLTNRKQGPTMRILVASAVVIAHLSRPLSTLLVALVGGASIGDASAFAVALALAVRAFATLLVNPLELIAVGLAIWVAIRRL